MKRVSKTPLQQLKAQKHGRRMWVIAQQYPSGLKVAAEFDGMPEQAEARARLIFNGQYANRREQFDFEVGIALCNVSRTGKVSWGLFEPMPAIKPEHVFRWKCLASDKTT